MYLRAMLVLSVLVHGCRSDDAAGTGQVRVQLGAEETISEGISKGEGVENARDYAVSYAKFLIAIGNVQLGKSSTGQQLQDKNVYIADLKQLGVQGVQLASFDDVSAGQWDEFGYELVLPDANTRALGNVSQSDLQQMVDNGWTYWIEGTVARAQAEGGPVTFVLQTAVPTLFDRCGIDGQPGLAVVADGTATGTITIHGDHLWFNSFPTGSEGTVERRTAWLVAADLDKDGKVSTEDLAALDATEVFTTSLGYSLDGAPVVIESALDFVRAQLATQGHFKGEGECIWHFEGVDGE
jgi:hypothetical protein